MAKLNTDQGFGTVLFPMAGWEVQQVDDNLLVVELDYAPNSIALEKERWTKIAFGVSPALALDLAERLKKASAGIVSGPPDTAIH